ncbi:MAG: chemotaxis protein CheR [Deltaproteobacteria bacterium]|nr:chemotaxis protein CheR [Deltaproteobacteria bacterium]
MANITKRQFKRYCDIVYNECGINLTEEKWQLLNARIGKRIRKLGVQPEKYLSMIEKDPDELNSFLDAVSTNHTYFFRESKTFKFLDTSCRNIWCTACSSGEEPYSLLTYCLELGFEPSILATDISDSCLEKARRAIYPKKSLAHIPKHMIKRYFQKGVGKWEDHVRLKKHISRMVMIYFDIPTKETVIHKLSKVLKPEGYFIIGGAESLNGLKHSLKYIEPSVYRK